MNACPVSTTTANAQIKDIYMPTLWPSHYLGDHGTIQVPFPYYCDRYKLLSMKRDMCHQTQLK